jgi:CRP/FNR family transcriptional regulator
LLASSRPHRAFGPEEELLDSPEASNEVFLLMYGQASFAAETPFGPHVVGTLQGPALLNLRRALSGPENIYRLRPDEGSEAVIFSQDEANRLLFDPGTEGQAFRRFALGSVASALRETNQALARFFDDLTTAEKAKTARDTGQFQAVAKPVTIDPSKVYDLFDAAGLNPSGLPDLGLVAQSVPSGGILVKAGTIGEEAYLLAEGRLRVSIHIPGVGEEALAILAVGEIVGEMALIDDAPRSADVIAHEGEALVYVLSRDVFKRLLESGDPAGAPLLAGITVALTRRLEESVRKTAGFRVLAGPF